ncbi:MAG: glycine--tRNA ligase subunit beta, partial [Eggerthellaceae bacterium]|nr:glycine--tRNA ligase subunit beta [Eggerthellaceae bacterium]
MAKKTIAFEIGTEELPAFALHEATKQVLDITTGQPGKLFDFDEVRVYSTPRRIILIITGVPEETPAFDEEFRGPAVRIAYDAAGNPTKAAAGFAPGKGVAVEDLIRKVDGAEEYV